MATTFTNSLICKVVKNACIEGNIRVYTILAEAEEREISMLELETK